TVFARELGKLANLLISRTAGTWTIVEICLSLFPGILIFTLPMAFLVGTLIGISRLSSDNEITALKAGGVNLLSILAPVLFLASIVSLVNFVIALHYLPMANNHLRVMKFNLASSVIPSELHARVFVEDFPNVILYADELE